MHRQAVGVGHCRHDGVDAERQLLLKLPKYAGDEVVVVIDACIVVLLPCIGLTSAEVEKMKTLKGLAIQDIVTEVHSFIHRFYVFWGSFFTLQC